ncbi:hypothetical protein Poly21_14480 [Allorhodopirellula heiligendammensis]|uniref:Uncharacterized protein n=1 Tax=Allorhodopirellula heiligendammensis TaxID=2714739 RepID=A0A5C6C715_9BACT|nr:hypothetical protein Poly21_14480 [Allorhodopirellula heiligendammensis]
MLDLPTIIPDGPFLSGGITNVRLSHAGFEPNHDFICVRDKFPCCIVDSQASGGLIVYPEPQRLHYLK